ncbi:hypothetical protein L3X38_018108 [Prunus dulcis]|uniref:Uncharacterized protein n=1 Tax=Prunus dulcis TaxID=3755 RepID=A0AAD4WAZ6_PRUDU|nr:hypothetical protein L3X38_018108 [Prunus dulcis]
MYLRGIWDPVGRKIIRSRDVVFFEDQNIEDIRRSDKLDNPREYPTNLDPVPPSLEHSDGRDESNDTEDPASDPIINEPVDDETSDDHTTDATLGLESYCFVALVVTASNGG